MRNLAAASILLVALAFGACGVDDEEGVASAFAQLRGAHGAGDAAEVCALLSSAARRELGELGHGAPSGCPRDVRERLSLGGQSPRDWALSPIRDIDIDGDRATVVAVLGGTTPTRVSFVKEDGAWKLGQLFGTTGLPPADLR